jgi:dipeptidyl aminopeptidase/acylaminoacyl peptidase
MKASEWALIVADLCERWPQQANLITESWIRVWYPDVEPYSADEIRQAIHSHTADDPTWLPNGGRLAKLAFQNREIARNNEEQIEKRKREQLLIDQKHAWDHYDELAASGSKLLVEPNFPRPGQKLLSQ